MRQRLTLAAALFAAATLSATAADHRDGPLATGDPAADLNDVYAFVNPNDAEELILIGTVQPAAGLGTRFSDAVEYRFHIDNGAANGTTLISCRFGDEGGSVLCRGAGDTLYAEGRVETIIDADTLRVFAGLRDDPFFFDLDAFTRTRTTLQPSFTNPGINFFGSMNTMAIVLGIQHERLTNNGANPVLKVYTSTNRISGDGISPGHSGTWFDVNNPGHGVFLHTLDPDASVENGPRRLIAHWAVFNNAGQQLNVYGVGNIDGDRATVPVITTAGGAFPPTTGAPVNSEFGTLEFVFNGCNSATMNVTPNAGTGFAATSVALTRLTNVEEPACTFYSEGQIDRNGRPAINTATIDLLASTGKKNAYNRAEDPTAWAGLFQAEMQANLTALDTLDGVSGNAILPAATLAAVLVDDRLQVNTSIPTCDAYLAVELGVAGQCGGRTLARDVMDDTLGAVVGPGVSDFVGNDSTVLADFPFMAPPQ